MENRIEIVDPTRLRASLQCLRLYYWSQERAIVPIKPRLPLIYGVSAHACFEAHYHGGSSGESLAAFEDTWARELGDSVQEYWDHDPKRNPRKWAEVFLLYKRRYPEEPFKVLTLPNGKPAIEVPFFLPLTKTLALAGIIDLVVEYLNRIILIDHKTTSYLNQKWIESFNPNHQFSAYLLAGNELLQPKKPIDTLLINAIKVHATDLRPEALFDRIPTNRSQQQLQAFKEELIGWWEVIRACRATGSWPRNDDRCGRWPEMCAYHPLCTDIEADYKKVIPSSGMYRKQVWDPVRKLREHGLKLPKEAY